MTEKNVATVIVIGDEILRGQVQDTNKIYLAKKLLNIGIKIQRVVVIPDEVDLIAKEVSEASINYPLVFTSGGVGPTHDDVTYEGVAKGLGLDLKENEELLHCLRKLFPDKPESRRLATVPDPCELIYVESPDSDASTFPTSTRDTFTIVKVRNVYILPGSPRYFRSSVDAIINGNHLEHGTTLHRDTLELLLDEFSFVKELDEVAKRWHGLVNIGSYPQESQSSTESGDKIPLTYITLEGLNPQDVEKAKKDILEKLTNRLKAMPILRGLDEAAAKAISEDAKDKAYLAESFAVMAQCYDRYKANEVFLSFNGGKDCTVVLHLAVAFARLHNLELPTCLYVTGDAFPEVEEFVEKAASYYGLELVRRDGSIRDALESLLKEKPELKACLLGTRKNDPGAHSLEPFAPTDEGWPHIMRVSPILHWSYSQVWQFLLNHQVPYCSLYDEGYTSLGSKDTTMKNPLLQDPNDSTKYLPAHTLADDSTERHGRV
ncbi:hypothetical protein QAD02_019016 [Eretmocerus hayati]|uniref:Uncharacterized protein n=1 Tax=Eretmocerus hayati TaxID=131215 RepID=A0ACC2PKW7_9HYME|nr:hypothetical protein QAD02_019016 [Eretmocerus hayati]